MTRNLRILAIALVAVFGLGAIGATAASAQFHSEQEEARITVTANEMQKFAPNSSAPSFECSLIVLDNTIFTGTIGSPKTTNTEITATPTIKNCEPFLNNSVAVDMNDCTFKFTLATNATSGEMHIECPAGKAIMWTVGQLCTWQIAPQSVGTVTYKNIGAGATREIEFQPDLTGISVSRTTFDSAICPSGGTTGKYLGNFRVKGEDPITSAQVGIWVS